MKQTGWGKEEGIPTDILIRIGWREYIAEARRPYPPHLLDSEQNRKCNQEYQAKEAKTNKQRSNKYGLK